MYFTHFERSLERWLDMTIALTLATAFAVALAASHTRRLPARLWHAILLSGAALGTLTELVSRGHRWQLVPLYAALAALLAATRISAPWRQLAALTAVAGTLLAALLAWGFPLELGIPPDGPYAVGTTIVHWVDDSREEWFTENANDARELMVQLWYPARPSDDDRLAPYFDHASERTALLAESLGLPAFVMGHLAKLQSRAHLDAPLHPERPHWPVIVFSHGLEGTRIQNTSLMEALASEGYVGAAIDHTYDSFLTIFPDGRRARSRSSVPGGLSDDEWLAIRGRQLQTRVDDVQFVLDRLSALNEPYSESRFADRLDLRRLGIAGHSFGGATATLAALADSRWRAVVALDGWFVPINVPSEELALAQPFLFLGQERWPAWNETRQRHHLEAILENGDATERRTVPGSAHNDFTDLPLFSPLNRYLGLTGPLDAEDTVRSVNRQVVEFFDQHLRSRSRD